MRHEADQADQLAKIHRVHLAGQPTASRQATVASLRHTDPFWPSQLRCRDSGTVRYLAGCARAGEDSGCSP
jgi:hypothetical protein